MSQLRHYRRAGFLAPHALSSARRHNHHDIGDTFAADVKLDNAGAHGIDQKVVVDGALTTSRNPDDLPAFVASTVEVLARARLSKA